MLGLVARLFQAWHESGIRYCYWKSTNHLAEAMRGMTDIDVLVDARQAAQAEALAAKHGYVRLQTDPLRGYPGVLDLVGLDVDTGRWVHLHVHYQLVLGDRWVKATWLPLEDLILRRATYDERYSSFVVSPYDELYLFCARMALKHRRPFDLNYVWHELDYIKTRVTASSESIAEQPLPFASLNQLAGCVLSDETPSRAVLNNLARETARSLAVLRRNGWTTFHLLSGLRRFYRYWIEARRRILGNYEKGRRNLPCGGRIVAFVGVDGCGKTSAVNRTARFFAQQLNVAQIFMGSGKSGARWYRRLVFAALGTRAKLRGHQRIRRASAMRGDERVPWYYALWILMVNYDKRRNLRRAIAARANGALVLCDRWPQGQVVGTFDGPRLSGVAELSGLSRYAATDEQKLIRLAEMVQPDLVLRFRVTPELACSRKPGELSREEAERNAQLLEEISWRAARVVDINADAPLEEVDRQIRTAIWATLRGAI